MADIREKGLLDGADYWAIVIDEKPPEKDLETGLMMKEYLIVPYGDMIESYPNIFKRAGSLTISTKYGMGRWMKFPVVWCDDENKNRKNSIVRILCTIDGKETAYTQKDKKYTNQINELSVENEHLRLQIYALREENREMMSEELVKAKLKSEIYKIYKGERRGQYEEQEFTSDENPVQ